MDVFVTREPVFDQKKDVYGYELLFRAGFEKYYATADAAEVLGGDKATVDFMAFVNFAELTDGKKGFVTFAADLLRKEFPSLLPSAMMVVGIAPNLTGDQEIAALLRKLKAAGCEVAINEFQPAHLDGAALDLADIAKVDFAATSAEDRKAIGEALAARGVKTLARNVETAEELDQACGWGYSYFHGTFFSKPVIRPERQIAANKLVYMQVLKEVNRAELPLDELEKLIRQDVAMTYKLLRFMNSVWFGLRYEVRSIKHALVLLGPKEVRKWASLLVVSGAGEDKPRELLRRSLARAHVAEKLAPMVGMPGNAPELFLLGMFSCVDALLDAPMAEVLDELALNESVKSALVGGTSRFRVVYDLILSYEKGDWAAFSEYAETLRVDEKLMPGLFWESLKWANQALEMV